MRRRLIVVSVAVTSMVALAFLVPLMLLTRQLASDRALAAAEQEAETAAQLLSATPGADMAEMFAALGFGGLSLILPDGTVVGDPVPPGEDLSLPRSGAAGSEDVEGGAAVYVPVANARGEILVVRSFVPDDDLTRGVGQSWATLAALAVLLVGVGVLVADRLARSIVKPAEELSRAAAELGDGHLDTRLVPSGPPELAAAAAEFNHLAGRIEHLLQQERETAADLSHRLRTPLTAARLNAESLPPGEMRDRLLDDLAGLERTVDQVIRDARRPAGEPQRLDVGAVVAERAAFWEALGDEQDRAHELLVAGTPAFVEADAGELAAALDALLGNVFAHTSEGVPYRLVLELDDRWVAVHVDDAGPGIGSPDAVFRGVSRRGSTGLGLDIARRTAERAGGSLETARSPLGGTRVTLRLPLVP